MKAPVKAPVPARPVAKSPTGSLKRAGPRAKRPVGLLLLLVLTAAAGVVASLPPAREEALRLLEEKRWLPTWAFGVVALAPVLVLRVWQWRNRRLDERPRTDMDAAVVIVDWIRRNPKKMRSSISFSRLDRELGLAKGTCKRLLVPSALRSNYSVEMTGERRVLFSPVSLMGGVLREPGRSQPS